MSTDAQRIAEALDYLTRSAEHTFRRTAQGQLIETLGCILTGRSSGWWPVDNQPDRRALVR